MKQNTLLNLIIKNSFGIIRTTEQATKFLLVITAILVCTSIFILTRSGAVENENPHYKSQNVRE